MDLLKLKAYLKADPTDPPWLKVMKDHIGPRHDYYYDFCDANPGDAWCACMIGWALHQCNIKGTGSAAANSYKTWEVPAQTYKKGNIVVFHWPDTAPEHGHVSILNDWDEDEGIVGCVGGNQSHAVKRSVYDMDYIVSMRFPKGV